MSCEVNEATWISDEILKQDCSDNFRDDSSLDDTTVVVVSV